MKRRQILVAAFLALCSPGRADPAIHYPPAENLEHVDVALIDGARHDIDMAAYVLTDWPIMQALCGPPIGASRSASTERGPAKVFQYLAYRRRVEIKTPRGGRRSPSR